MFRTRGSTSTSISTQKDNSSVYELTYYRYSRLVSMLDAIHID